MSPQNTHSIDDYEQATRGAGWLDRRDRGRLRFNGRDVSKFLHALVSHDVESLRDGEGRYATYLTPQGRMIADLRIHHLGRHFLADVAPGKAAALATRFDLAVFAEDVQVIDVSTSVAQLAVVGPTAAAVLARAFGSDEAAIAALPVLHHLAAGDRIIVRTDDTNLPSYDVFLPATLYADTESRLIAAGAMEMSAGTFDALRIEAGRPAFGIDMTEETIPLEAGLLDRAISMTKGCYVGQEVIVRVLHRGGGRVAKRLVVLTFEDDSTAPPPAGTPIAIDGRDVGRVTSAAFSSGRGAVVALGYLQRDAAEIGRRVTAAARSAVVSAIAG